MIPPSTHTPAPRPLWFSAPGAAERFYFGVFEGGGAKGIAFVGALRAMRDSRAWFASVAGASAGAITAGLIAAGLSPEEIERATSEALRSVKTSLGSGLARLRQETGFFDGRRLELWLDELFWAQESVLAAPLYDPVAAPADSRCRQRHAPPAAARRRVTFARLHELTGVELNIVAADISARRQMIFSHHDTPHCQVAAAIAASSAIPFAFESRLLTVTHAGEQYHHTIVDGGVWSNFPMFVYEDQAFRAHYMREPAVIPAERILGFLLDEVEEYPALSTADSTMVEGDLTPVRALEWQGQEGPGTRRFTLTAGEPGRAREAASAAAFPLALLGKVVTALTHKPERGRWPSPRSRLAIHLIDAANGLLAGLTPWFFAFSAAVGVAIGSSMVLGWAFEHVVAAVILPVEPREITERLMKVLFYAAFAGLAVLFAAASIVGLYANRLLAPAARRILYGLMSTFAAGSGAPTWARMKPNVVRLPVHALTTLGFEPSDAERDRAFTDAYDATRRRLRELDAARSPAA